jgi:hypothetical protein
MSRGIQILGLMDELGKMPEYTLFMQLQGFSTSIYTFDKNFQDLIKLLNFLADDPRAEPLFWLRNRDQLMLVMQDIIRLIHNFVAAALSLIDHTRRLYNKLYPDTGQFLDYESKISSEFAHDPLSQFVKCLRQYCQHYKAPNLDVTTSWKQGDEKPTMTFNLLKVDLESFDGWSVTAKKYLDGVTEKVNILEVAVKYREKVIAFYEWFQSRQGEIHAGELRYFREKESQLLSLMLEDKIDMSFAQSRQGIPHQKDDVFTSIFTSPEFDELEKIPRDSPNRPLRAIELLEQRLFPISQEMKQNIIRLYELPDILPEQNNELDISSLRNNTSEGRSGFSPPSAS